MFLDSAMKRRREIEGREKLDLGTSPMLLSQPQEFECKTCNRKFSSFQALGGHRASHKRPKLEAQQQQNGILIKQKMHECHVCGQKFSVGQALGGHMRKHRAAMEGSFPSMKEVVAKVPVLKRSNSTRVMCLDLNLTPLENDLKLLFGNKPPPLNLSLCS